MHNKYNISQVEFTLQCRLAQYLKVNVSTILTEKKTLSYQMLQEKVLTKFNIHLQIKILNFQLTHIEKNFLNLKKIYQ